MRIRQLKAQVRPPATCSNLGPGLGAFALALDMRDSYTLEVTTSSLDIRVYGEGAELLPRDDSHRTVEAIRETLEAVGAPQVGIRLTCHNVIPHAKGLGSRAAATVAGIALARAILEEPSALDTAAMLDIASGIDGSANRVAAGILGGVTVSYTRGSGASAHRLEVGANDSGPALRPVVICPAQDPQGSADLRLRRSVELSDAQFNIARAALLVHALANEPDALLGATADQLHQESRSAAAPDSFALMKMLRQERFPAVLSGSGATVLVLRGDSRAVAARVQDMVDDPSQWRIAHVPVAELGVSTVLG